jgi:hypothetical protein
MADPKLTLNAFQPQNLAQLRPSLTGRPAVKIGGASRVASVLDPEDDDSTSAFAKVLSRVSQGSSSASSAQLEQDDIEDVEDDE